MPSGERWIDAFDGAAIGAHDRHTPSGVLEDPGPALELFPDLDPLSDVSSNSADSGDLAVGTMQRRQRGLHVAEPILRLEGPLVGDALSGQSTRVCCLMHRRLFRSNDLSNRSPDEGCGLDSFPLEPAPEGMHAALIPIQPEHDVVDRFNELTERLFSRQQLLLRLAALRARVTETNQSIGGGDDSEGEPLIGWREEFLQLDGGSLGVRAEGFCLKPASGQARERVPDILPQQLDPAVATGAEQRISLGIQMGHPPLLIAAQKRFSDVVEDLRGLACLRIFP